MNVSDGRDAAISSWLEAVLGVPAPALVPASSDASFRRYLRIATADGTRVVMDAPPERESCGPFLTLAARLVAHGVHAPAVHAAAPDLGLVLLEDLGDRCFLDEMDEERAERLYGLALDTLVRVQQLPADGLADYDRGPVGAELALFPTWFLERHLGIEVEGELARLLETTGERLVAAFAEQPQVFVHRDYHSRNLMFLGDEEPPGVIDFQDALRGPVGYDLASLLRDVYLRWPRARIDGWIDEYHRRASAAGLLGAGDRERLRRWVELCGVQRHLKVAGIFARLWYRDGKARYLDDIPLTLDYLLEVAARHPETAELAAALDALDVRARNRERSAALPEAVR